MSNVTIIGGHGKVALLLAPLLKKAGHEVSSWIRNPEHVADVEATGAEAVVADPESLGIVLGGSGNGEQLAANRRHPYANYLRVPDDPYIYRNE